MDDQPKNILIVTKDENEKEFALIEQIRKSFKITNVKSEGNAMLIDLTNVKEKRGTSKILPEGEYNAWIDRAELVTTKAKDGKFIRAMWKIADSNFKNRTVFHNFNILSAKPETAEKAQGHVKALLLMNKRKSLVLQTEKDMIGLRAKITVEVFENSFGRQNKVTAWREPDFIQEWGR